MNKKGFTLIEVLAVVVLLGFIALIALPTVREMMEKSKQKLYNEQIILIENGLKNWASANIFLLPEKNETIKLSLGQLKQAGYLELKITNPKNNKCISNETLLNITKYDNSYIYEVEDVINVSCDLIKDTPTIQLNGSVVEILNVGNAYLDKGVIAKDLSGRDITNSVITTISGSGTEIDTTKTGSYIIEYSITNNGKTMTAIRNVFVK